MKREQWNDKINERREKKQTQTKKKSVRIFEIMFAFNRLSLTKLLSN